MAHATAPKSDNGCKDMVHLMKEWPSKFTTFPFFLEKRRFIPIRHSETLGSCDFEPIGGLNIW